MRERLLEFLCCPDCHDEIKLEVFDFLADEIISGVLYCPQEHFFPISGGIPRLLPNSLKEYWREIESSVPSPVPVPIKSLFEKSSFVAKTKDYDTRTKTNFSNEWDNHQVGGKTWTMDLDDRVQWFFLDPIKIPKEELSGKLMLDAGCGNGSQSVAYTEFGLEVVALDLSTGLEKGYAFRKMYNRGNPKRVHFVQADLQNPPLVEGVFDIIHSAGVLHHTPNTEETFRQLRPLLKSGGTMYVWLYKYENIVTPIVNTLRVVTTRIPSALFSKVADLTSISFIGFCWTVNKLGIRKYETLDRREATLAIHDIFGAPYAHYHSFDEVANWFKSVGITEIWPCNDDRRGFGVCGKVYAEDTKNNFSIAKI